jgi:hypothetical protein
MKGDVTQLLWTTLLSSFLAILTLVNRSFLFSFAPVVLALKVLLNQQGLDLPFTGGLGSYKLYVLVAYHVS